MLYKFNFTALMLSKAIKDWTFALLKKKKKEKIAGTSFHLKVQ